MFPNNKLPILESLTLSFYLYCLQNSQNERSTQFQKINFKHLGNLWKKTEDYVIDTLLSKEKYQILVTSMISTCLKVIKNKYLFSE